MTTEINIDVAKHVLSIVDAGLVKGIGNPVAGQMCVEAAVCYALGLPHGDDPKCVSRALRSLKIQLNDSAWSSNQARAKGLRRLALIQLGSRDFLNDIEFAKHVAELAIRLSVPAALRSAANIHKNPSHKQALRDAADRCEKEGTLESAGSARAAAFAAFAGSAGSAGSARAAAFAAFAARAAAFAAFAARGAAFAGSAARAAAFAAFAARGAAFAGSAGSARAAAFADKGLTDFAEGVVQILISMNVPGVQWLPLTESES
jgi:hypothetical protein